MNWKDRLERFTGEQDNLDAVYWLMQGLSYRDIGEKIRRSHSFVQRVNNFLKNNGLTTAGQWKIDVNALQMIRTFKFYRYAADRPKEVVDNDDFLTYFADIKKGKSGHFALYTFPNEIESKVGKGISPFYYYVPKFKAPLCEQDMSLKTFKDVYESQGNENPLPSRGEGIDPDIIHIEIARYVELFGIPVYNESKSNKKVKNLRDKGSSNISFSKFVEIIKDDIQEELGGTVDVTYDIVRNRYNDMLKKHIIYLGFGLDMRNFGYALSLCWIKTGEIYRIIRTFSHFNVICALAYTNKNNRYLLHLQYPKIKEVEVFYILNDLDSENEVFKILGVHNNRILPHSYYFEKERGRRK